MSTVSFGACSPLLLPVLAWLVAMFASSDLEALAAQELGQTERPTARAEAVAVGTSLGPSSSLGVEVGRPATPPPQVATSTPSILNEAFVVYKLPSNLHSTFLEMIGSEDGEDDLDVVAHVPPEIITSAMDVALDRDGNLLSPLQKGHLVKFLKTLRKLYVEEPTSAVSVAAAPNITVTVPDTSDKYHLKDYIDQTSTGVFDLLPVAELTQLRKNFNKATGASPTNAERPSDEQLSALAHKLRPQKGGHMNSPWVEFAVWGPFDGRTARMRMFTAHVLTRDGTWAHKRLRGPSSFVQWEASWDVFAAAMVMLGLAAPGVLRQYAAGIKRLDRLFPHDWPTISALDEEMRCEQWGRLRQEIVDGDENMPAGWQAESPWASIIAATRSIFWQALGPTGGESGRSCWNVR